ncbi:MAG: hypothetical protein AXW15_08985 [Neptuniibacter sp. Phe_28]|nr:MAG: hypothetical protein AXW15_08985 [Neptuniibacter sp. Phe_28]
MSWPLVNINDICRPKQWKTVSSSKLLEEGYPVYGANGRIGYYSEYTHEFPTLMITCRGATCGNVHISVPKAYINGNAMALDGLDSEKYSIKYLFYYFKSRGFNDVISGSAQPQITRQGLSKIEIPLPPLPVQKKIAAVLEKADTLRSQCLQMEQELNSLAQSVFLDMFGDPVLNPNYWPQVTISDIVRKPLQNGAYYEKELYTEDGVEMAHMSDTFYGVIKRGSIKRVNVPEKDIKKYAITNNDILVTRRSLVYEGAAKPCLIPRSSEPLIYESSMIRVSPDLERVLPEYLFHYLCNDRARAKSILPYVTKSTISGINQTNLSKVVVQIPPIELQIKFVDKVKAAEQLKCDVVEQFSNLQDNFNSLMQRAFKGELELKDVA